MRIINHSYNNTIDIVFDTFKHQYSVDGEVIPGCTSVLGILSKPALLYWSANMASDYWKENIKPGESYDELQLDSIWQRAKKAHTQKKTDSATLGSFVHKWAEDYINGKDPGVPINEQMKGSVERWMKWGKDHDVKFLLSEQLVFSKSLKYAGTTDFICKIDGKMWLGDIKTSNAIYDEYLAQTAAYLHARTEEYPQEKYEGVVIVRVGKEDGELETVTKKTEELELYFNLFKSCLSTYNSLKAIEAISGK